MPEIGKRVLVNTTSNGYFVCYRGLSQGLHSDVVEKWLSHNDSQVFNLNITYWKPLPAPPKQ